MLSLRSDTKEVNIIEAYIKSLGLKVFCFAYAEFFTQLTQSQDKSLRAVQRRLSLYIA